MRPWLPPFLLLRSVNRDVECQAPYLEEEASFESQAIAVLDEAYCGLPTSTLLKRNRGPGTSTLQSGFEPKIH